MNQLLPDSNLDAKKSGLSSGSVHLLTIIIQCILPVFDALAERNREPAAHDRFLPKKAESLWSTFPRRNRLIERRSGSEGNGFVADVNSFVFALLFSPVLSRRSRREIDNRIRHRYLLHAPHEIR